MKYLMVLGMFLVGCFSYEGEPLEAQESVYDDEEEVENGPPLSGHHDSPSPPVGGGCGHDVIALPYNGEIIWMKLPIPCAPIEYPLDDPIPESSWS